MTRLKTFLRDESGATVIEYSLLAAMMAIVAIAVLTATGTSMSDLFYGPVNDTLAR